ncbi:hypothetical protein GYMLUDRAFT_561592 [Collybiopsis luxurians FD-317 M1]|uniref:PAS domain-containing protein n=1 Tax=Collybiopsis luxurians FD-317 M1 TaxID=944289 RepID=A0A0D0CS14_9AGAR|nr:hypothetical protein GYMLUDRAFT_561592 [Collybiopsis luxurians FD-317 M1]
MPFSRYLQGSFSSEFPDIGSSAVDMLIDQVDGPTTTTATPATSGSASHHHRHHHATHTVHPVRLQIPQYMQSGLAPILAPGGGAEVLPAGLFHRPASPANACGFKELSKCRYSQTFVYPAHHQEQTDATTESSHSTPFDFDSSPPPTALSLGISSGLINPQNRLTPHQLDVIGASAGASLGGSSSLNAPSPLGLPVYSRSGFDLLSVLARVAARPDPKIHLGPVDLSSSFVVVDVRRYDHPTIYCSPTFCRLTGYSESEVLGKNCRFLQSPNGHQPRGEYRHFTSNEAVSYLKKNLVADKECQTSIINYRKGGEAFINLVTVIPIKGGDIGNPQEDDKVIYHVGFQVDLTEQPNAILEKLKDGSYISNYAANNPVSIVPPLIGGGGTGLGTLGSNPSGAAGAGAMLPALMTRDRKLHSIPPPAMSKELKKLIEDPGFINRHPVSTSANADASPASSSTLSASNSTPASALAPPTSTSHDLVAINPSNPSHPAPANHPLSMLLLEYAPDFIHIVSLKGQFLYVAPSVRRVLGYEPEELLGKGLAEICHPADQTPVMRELKESSATGGGGGGGAGPPLSTSNSSNGSSNNTGNGTSNPKSATSPTTSSMEDTHQNHSLLHKPRSVDLLFRAKTKSGMYIWVECRGRLHVEPGKGRKAIMLSGRAKEMGMGFQWSAVAAAGGLSVPRVRSLRLGNDDGSGKGGVGSGVGAAGGAEVVELATEFWGTLTRSGTLLVVGKGVKDVLGFDETELMGRPIFRYLVDEETRGQVGQELRSMGCAMGGKDSQGSLPRKIWGRMVCKDAYGPGVDVDVGGMGGVPVELVLYPTAVDMRVLESPQAISPAPVIYQVKLLLDTTASASGAVGASTPTPIIHPLRENIFKELEILRQEPWQYELQQLRIQNERMREEIRSLEEEVEEKGEVITATTTIQSSRGNGNSHVGHGLDHHLHQIQATGPGLGSTATVSSAQGQGPFQTPPANPSSLMSYGAPSYGHQGSLIVNHSYPLTQSHPPPHPHNINSLSHSHPLHHLHTQAHHHAVPWPSSPISMQMPFVPPGVSSMSMPISPTSSSHSSSTATSSSLKRSWSSSNGDS